MNEVVRELQAGGSGATNRLGAALAPFGVRYLVLVQRPWKGGLRQRVDPGFAQHLFGQLDFRQIDVGGDVILLENTRWVPIRSLVPGKIGVNTASLPGNGSSTTGPTTAGATVALNGATALLPLEQTPDVGAAPAIATEIVGTASVPSPRGPFVGSTAGEPTLAVAGTYDSGWKVTAGGKTVRPTELANGTMAFDLAAVNPGALKLDFTAGLAHSISLLLQGLLWAFAFVVLFIRRSRRSGSRESQLLQVEAAAARATEQSGPIPGTAADDDDYLDFSGSEFGVDEGGGVARARKVVPRVTRSLRAPSRFIKDPLVVADADDPLPGSQSGLPVGEEPSGGSRSEAELGPASSVPGSQSGLPVGEEPTGGARSEAELGPASSAWGSQSGLPVGKEPSHETIDNPTSRLTNDLDNPVRSNVEPEDGA
jgi:hypothetical protein